MKNPKKVKLGKKSRAAGKRFELKVRADLEKKGWIVFRNSNDVEWPDDNINKPPEERIGIFKQAKTKWMFNPVLKRAMPAGLQSGFPDFICIRPVIASSCETYLVKEKKVLFPKIPKREVRHSSEELIDKHETLGDSYKVQFVECKGGDEKHKYLDANEKEKVEWIRDNLKIPVVLATKGEKRGEIEYG